MGRPRVYGEASGAARRGGLGGAGEGTGRAHPAWPRGTSQAQALAALAADARAGDVLKSRLAALARPRGGVRSGHGPDRELGSRNLIPGPVLTRKIDLLGGIGAVDEAYLGEVCRQCHMKPMLAD